MSSACLTMPTSSAEEQGSVWIWPSRSEAPVRKGGCCSPCRTEPCSRVWKAAVSINFSRIQECSLPLGITYIACFGKPGYLHACMLTVCTQTICSYFWVHAETCKQINKFYDNHKFSAFAYLEMLEICCRESAAELRQPVRQWGLYHLRKVKIKMLNNYNLLQSYTL